MSKFLVVILFVIFIFSACEKEQDSPGLKNKFSHKGIFIVNEGNLGYGNASLSYYEADSMIISNSVFQKRNGFSVGDALQSLNIKDSLGFLCVSNSGKIVVFNTNSFNHVATMGGFTAPRYIEFLPGNKAVVSDLYSEELSFVDLEDYSISSRMNLGGSSEQMLLVGKFLYVISWSFNNKIYKIDPENYVVIDSLTTGIQPNSIILDKEGFLWVLSDGGYEGNPFGHDRPGLLKINLENFSKVMYLDTYDINSSPSDLHLGAEGNYLYFIDSGAGNQDESKGIFRMSINATELPLKPFIEEGNRLLYGLGINPENGDIYCSDAKDYLQKGTVYRYNTYGEEIDRFDAGIIPGEFIFLD
jgi:DNA-binding beta-propeller fold protein YncE